MIIKKSIETFNALIHVHTDRIHGYKTAMEDTDDVELKTLCTQNIAESEAFVADLSNEVKLLGGTPDENGTTAGTFRAIWMELSAMATAGNPATIVRQCLRGDDNTLEEYNRVLTQAVDYLTIEQHKMIYKQYIELQHRHEALSKLRDVLPENS